MTTQMLNEIETRVVMASLGYSKVDIDEEIARQYPSAMTDPVFLTHRPTSKER